MAPSIWTPPNSSTANATASTPTQHRPGFLSPAAMYHSVSGHLVSLVTSRPLPSQRRLPQPTFHKKRVRGFSDASLTIKGSSCSSFHDNDDHRGAACPNPLVLPLLRADPFDEDDNGIRGMRAEQAVCRNCRGLYFVGMVVGGPFCSLDCRTCFQFADRLQRELHQTLATSSLPTTLSVGDSEGDDIGNEEHSGSMLSFEDPMWVAM